MLGGIIFYLSTKYNIDGRFILLAIASTILGLITLLKKSMTYTISEQGIIFQNQTITLQKRNFKFTWKDIRHLREHEYPVDHPFATEICTLTFKDGTQTKIVTTLPKWQELISEIINRSERLEIFGKMKKYLRWEYANDPDIRNMPKSKPFRYSLKALIFDLFIIVTNILALEYIIKTYSIPLTQLPFTILYYVLYTVFALLSLETLIRYFSTKYWYTEDALFMESIRFGLKKSRFVRWRDIISINNKPTRYTVNQQQWGDIPISKKINNCHKLINFIVSKKPKEALLLGNFKVEPRFKRRDRR